MRTKLPLYLALLLLTQCSSCKDHDPAPVDQLPPATQTGANTLGCLVNGQPWTPQGNAGTSNYSISYDPTFRQGSLNVAAYRYTDGQAKAQAIGISSDSLLPGPGQYKLRTLSHHGAGFVNELTNCVYYPTDSTVYCYGTLTITRLDRTKGIIAGTFSFTLAKPGCDTVRVTDGRFDKQL